jgi:predicted ATPase/class 3 adenylate cyclase
VLVIEGFAVGELLNGGAQYATYRAVRQTDRLPVVLKVPVEAFPSARVVARLRHEFELTGALALPGIIRGVDLFPHKNGLVLVLEDIGGVALSVSAGRRALPVARVLRIGVQLAETLASVHAAGIIHKDIKPSNVIVAPDGEAVRLTDFGIAVRLARALSHQVSPGLLEGTLAYMAPEQTGRMNRAVDRRSDLYSLGATLYELLTGASPFVSDDPLEVVHQHVARAPVPVAAARPAVPAVVSDVVQRLLQKNAEDRYQTARGLAHDLRRCLADLAPDGAIAPFPLGRRDASDAFQIPQKLFGREREVAALRAALDRAARGGVELLRVHGPSGIGKSALVGEATRLTAAARATHVGGKFDQYRRDLPYTAVLQAFAQLAQQLLTEPEARLLGWRAQLVGALGPNARVLVDLVPELAPVLGPQPDVPALGLAEAQVRFTLVLRGFVRALASAEHPLVLFLDDLQWADGASLALLQSLLTDREVSHLLVIAAYRDAGLDAAHPLRAVVREVVEAGLATVTVVEPGPLGRDAIAALLAETLGSDPAAVAALAELVEAKTEANPFFVAEFLRSLHRGGHVRFDADAAAWRWDVAAARQERTTDNVVDLVVARINRLAPATRAALRVAAVVGHRFDLVTLARVTEAPPRDVAAALEPALAADVIVPLDDDYKYSALADGPSAIAYAFAHDRVHQAAYGLIADDERPRVHRTVGRLMLAAGPDEHLFDVANHLNAAADLPCPDGERRETAALNLRAARKANASMAYGAARRYADAGRALLGEGAWADHPELARGLHFEALKTAFLLGRYDEIDALHDALVAHAASPRDAALATEVKLQHLVSTMRYGEAMDVAVPALAALGVALPRRAHKGHVVRGLLRTKWALRGRDVASLAGLPAMADEGLRVAMRVVVTASVAAYATEPDVFPVMVFELVRRSLAHGNAPQSAFGYVCYGLALCAVLGDMAGGLAFGRLSVAMLDRVDARELEAKVRFLMGLFIQVWSEPLGATLPGFRAGAARGLETGDLEYYSYNLFALDVHELFQGSADLGRIEAAAEGHHRAIVEQRQTKVSLVMVPVREAVAFLRGAALSIEGAPDEPAVLARCVASGDRTSSGYCYVFRCMRHALAGEHRAALDAAAGARGVQEGLDGQLFVPIYQFYESLAELALQREAGRRPARVAGNQRRLAAHARRVPETFAAKWHLVEAERARNAGDAHAAMRRYGEAVRHAQKAANLHDQALAHGLAGETAAAAGLDTEAGAHASLARAGWERWGAAHLARRVDATRAWALPAQAESHRTSSVTDSSGGALDVESITRAARAVAAQLRLADVVRELMSLAASSAGARRGVLVLGEGEPRRFVVRARTDIDGGVVLVDGEAVEEAGGSARAALQYVLRSRQPVVLDDAAREGMFASDPGVAASRARSVLCFPMLRKGELAGAIYLENELVAGAFTRKRVAFLEVIAAQAAISIENAGLYRDLERALERQIELTTAHARFVPHQFLASLGRENIKDVRLGDHTSKVLSVLFSDIRGFTSLVERMSREESIRFINEYLSHMEPPVLENHGFVDSYIGDAVMALFDTTPDDAVAAGVGMLRALRRYNAERPGAEPVRIGIGINTGAVTLGTIGGANRIKCGVIGDPVNLAARIETATKQFGASLLVGESTVEAMVDPGRFLLRPVERVTVVGRSTPLTLYEAFDADDEAVRDAKRASLGRYTDAMGAYYARRWAEARGLFGGCAGDPVARAFAARCEALEADDPGPGWDGVVRLDRK